MWQGRRPGDTQPAALLLTYFCFCQMEVLGPLYLGPEPNIWTHPVEMQGPRNPTARPHLPLGSPDSPAPCLVRGKFSSSPTCTEGLQGSASKGPHAVPTHKSPPQAG